METEESLLKKKKKKETYLDIHDYTGALVN